MMNNEKPTCTIFNRVTDIESSNLINWSDILTRAKTPVSMAKNDCPCIASHLLNVKTKEPILKNNEMTFLWVDIDTGNKLLDEIKEILTILGSFEYLIYSTKSSTKDNKKWRILIPLKVGIPCLYWIKIQSVLIDVFDGDSCAKRVQQVLFLPNKGEFYEYDVQNGEHINLAIFEPYIKQLEKAEKAFNDYKPKPQKALKTGQISVINTFNNENLIDDLVTQYGYIKKGNKWLYKDSSSGIAGGVILDNKFFTNHSGDPLCDGLAHDSFDLYCSINGLTEAEAIKKLSKELLTSEGSTIDAHNKNIHLKNTPPQQQIKKLPAGWEKAFIMTDEEMDKIADPTWVYENLIILGHLIAIPAPPNGGKTTIFMWICGQICKDMKVFYVNADVSGADSKRYYQQAKAFGFSLLLPDMKAGKSMDDIVVILEQMNSINKDYSDTLFVFDTLKKMTDVINKNKAKELYKILRGLTAKGMTIILLSHTNKYKGADGELVYEGTGDLRADVDELIYLIPQHNEDKSMTVSTKPDKVRGDFKPITFNINSERDVSLADEFIDISDELEKEAKRKKDNFIIDAIYEALGDKLTTQVAISKYCNDTYKIGVRSTTRILKEYSKGDNRLWRAENGFKKNRINYYPLSSTSVWEK